MTAREAIVSMRDMISDRHGDYHDDADCLRYLNRAAAYVSAESESVRSGIYRAVNEGQSSYGLPPDVLQIDFVGFRGKPDTRYYPLSPLRQASSVAINSQPQPNDTPVYYSLWGRAQQERWIGEAGWASENQGLFAAVGIPVQGASRVRGNDRVINITDGSEGFVQRVITLDSPDYSPPVQIGGVDVPMVEVVSVAGGVRNNIEVGDDLRILSPDHSNQTLNISPPPDFTSEPGEENLFVYHAHRHRVITQKHIDDENDVLEIDPNLEEAFLHRMCYYASVADKNVADATAEAFEGKYNYYYKRAMPRVREKIRQFRSLWFAGQAIAPVRDVKLIGYSDVIGHTGNTYKVL